MLPLRVTALTRLLTLALPAQKRWAPDTAEPGSAETIATFTTEPRLGHPRVSYVPDAATVGGGVKNQDAPEGRTAILDISLGKCHVVAYNLNPMHRDLHRSGSRPIRSARHNRHALVRQPIILNEGSRP